jgi:hypothetical protein
MTWNSPHGSNFDLRFKICLSLTLGNLCYFSSALLTRTKTSGLNIPTTHPSPYFFFQIHDFIVINLVAPRFIDSEADLDTAIKSLLPLSQSPALAYPELVRSGMLTSLVGLLTHENMDIVIDVVELIYELTDEDANMEYEDENYEMAEEPLKILVEGLVSYSDWLETPIKTGCRSKILPLNYWLIIYHV